ncbi:MAG: uroporphyrinogen-III synthase [Alphaproteobacteria bacterium]|nr:uroporphyrinogen-III synthase [Alphaproteobacteria bacterium]
MRALITRPAEDAKSLHAELRRRGIAVTHEPMLTIERMTDVTVDMTGVQGLLFTSSNGVRAFARLSDHRDLPAFAVGDATAQACRDAGFLNVHSASGDVDALANYVIRHCQPYDGRLLQVAGTVSAGDLSGALRAAGFTVDRIPIYEAHAAEALSSGTRTAMKNGRIDAVLFFSPRTASTFVTLAQSANLENACRNINAYCLSPAVAKRAAALPWKRVTIAAEPTQAALLASLDTS